MRCRSSTSRSCSVSMKPLITVSGVLSSCDTLAMKSRRMRATASSSVTSRDISSFWSAANGTSCSASVRPASRLDGTTMDVAVIAGLEVAQELRLADEVDDRLAAILREVEAELRERARVRPVDAIARVEHDDAVGNRRGRLPEALDDVPQVALVRARAARARR